MTKPTNLTCPYCGSSFSVQMETHWEGYGPMEKAKECVSGFGCDNDDCDARWDSTGFPVLAPRAPFSE